jgi:hypothetical protein
MVTNHLPHLATHLLRSVQRPALRALSIAAVAGLLISAMPREAAAQNYGNFNVILTGNYWTPPPQPPAWVGAPYTLSFTRLECLDESGEFGSDEPYVLFLVGDIKNPRAARMFRTSIFSDVDSSENRFQTINIWQSAPMPLGNPDNLIVLAQVMEHDYSPVSTIHANMSLSMPFIFEAAVRNNATREAIVGAMQWAMFDEIDNQDPSWGASWIVGDNLDDYVGTTQELRLTTTDMQTAYLVTPAQRTLDSGTGGTRYRTYYQLRHG